MAITKANLVRETTTTAGTTNYSLGGATGKYQTFLAGIGNGNKCYYCCFSDTDFEVGIGTLTAGSPDAQAMTRKQCAVLFAVGGAVCATATITGQVGIALACWAGSVTAVCNCTKYIPIKLCDD